jgi:predicted PurR-regulated permease PerM
MIVFSLIIGIIIAFAYNPEMVELRDKLAMNPKALSITILLVIVVILVFFGAFWAFYRLLYGFLLRRLQTNYNELKKIDF